MVDLSIIIVSYNTKEFLKNCLVSIPSSINGKPSTTMVRGKFDYEVIVVDNNSSDGTIKEVQSSKFKVQSYSLKLKVIQNKKNLGFSRANNIGVKQAKGRYLLFLNPDTIVYPNTLQTMVEFMDKHKNVGAATCKVVMTNGELDDASHRGFPTPWNSFCYFIGLSRIFPKSRIFTGYNLGWLDLNSVHEIDALAGAFMMVRRDAGERIGWWDEDYFFYGEDLDFCYELKQKKWKVYYVPTISILHYKGVSGGIKKISREITTADRETKERAVSERFEAMRIFYKKHYLKKYPSLITWLVFCGIGIKLWFATKRV